MKILVAIFLGGGFGSVIRYGLSTFIETKASHNFPLGILIVNILGCFLMGLFMAYLQKEQLLDSEWRFLLTTGFCGGFTTFSTFAHENVVLFEKGFHWAMIANISLSIFLGLLALQFGQIVFMKMQILFP